VKTTPWFADPMSSWRRKAVGGGPAMIVLGIILLIVGYLLAVPILWTIGIILVIVGLALWILGSLGHAIGGHRHYF
jgi:fatty-acid desaturase